MSPFRYTSTVNKLTEPSVPSTLSSTCLVVSCHSSAPSLHSHNHNHSPRHAPTKPLSSAVSIKPKVRIAPYCPQRRARQRRRHKPLEALPHKRRSCAQHISRLRARVIQYRASWAVPSVSCVGDATCSSARGSYALTGSSQDILPLLRCAISGVSSRGSGRHTTAPAARIVFVPRIGSGDVAFGNSAPAGRRGPGGSHE